MIKYKLICKDCDIRFDSWFASSNEYEKLKKKKYLNCHNCHSTNVIKSLMTPQLINSKENSSDIFEPKKYAKIKTKIKNYQKFIKENFKHVGDNFAYEARSIHYDTKKKSKNIYGSASHKDIKELKEEGIETQFMPWINDSDN